MAALLSTIARMFGGDDRTEYQIADIYTSMRGMVFQINDDQISELKGKPVWAVLMETGYEGAGVTVVAIAEGTASLYFSNGGGMIGLGEHTNVRPACLAMVAESERHINKMKKTEDFPLPKIGETIFYVITPGGTYTYKAKEDDLGNKRDELFPFFYDGHELITQMRIADKNRKAEPSD